jgi:hypothetical protein
VSTLADRGCRVVSATDPHDRNLSFLDPAVNPITNQKHVTILLKSHSASTEVIQYSAMAVLNGLLENG